MVPAADRLSEVRELVATNSYFVVHAPRQTGKTTSLMALCQEFTASGKYAALHFSCERAEAAREDYGAAEVAVIRAMEWEAEVALPEEVRPPAAAEDSSPGSRISDFLRAWAQACPRPIVLVFDEIDALHGASLISVLRQLRSGFPSRPGAFPASVVLCGLRDVRDYKMASGGDAPRLGTSSPFNVKVKSLKLGTFTREQASALYLQHTRETGQEFRPEALERAYEITQGQPWLHNALAKEVVEEMDVPVTEAITAGQIQRAKERLILARATHLDSLVARLGEERVRRFIQPLIAGEMLPVDETYNDDLLYVRDLGLLAPDNPLRIANPIYREVILRVLAQPVETQITHDPRRFVLGDGRLDMDLLLREFVDFWVAHSEVLTGSGSYREVAPQLVLMAWLHRIVNGGGYVEREVGVGRGRIDVLVKWPYTAAPSGKQLWQHEGIELKVWADRKPDPLAQGLKQLDAYLASLSLDHGYLAIFDRRTDALPIEERCGLHSDVTPSGKPVVVVRL